MKADWGALPVGVAEPVRDSPSLTAPVAAEPLHLAPGVATPVMAASTTRAEPALSTSVGVAAMPAAMPQV